MLRVRTLYASSAGATARYYTRYLEDPSEEPGRWRGGEAGALGLDGTVDTDQLEALLAGQDPVSGRQLGSALRDRFKADGTVVKAVAGYDATFSAPKSLSVWWALTGDRGLLDAHDVAVATVLDHLEHHGATTRTRHDGDRAFVDTGGLTMAAFRQSTSREDDPQIHTHVVISTKVRTADGRWYALDGRYLKRKQRTLGGIYQSVLRAEIAHRYGLEWGPIADGQAELAAMPAELLDAFSKRAEQVERYLELKVMAFREIEGRDPTRWERAALTREAAGDSRRAKTGSSTVDVRQVWRDEAADLGWSGDRLVEALAATPRRPMPPEPVTVDEVLDRLSAASSTWLPIDVVRVLCDVLPPDGDRSGAEWMEALEHAAARVTAGNAVLDPETPGPVRGSDGRSIWVEPIKAHLTDQRIVDQEERILAFGDHARTEVATPSPTVDTNRLDALQADAARAVAGQDRLALVVGPAGTGKTTTLARAVADLDRAGRTTFGVAPTAKAARVLANETGMRTDTVAKLLHEWARPDGPRNTHRLPAGTTLIVDETGMVGTGSLDGLVTLARQNAWRLVLVGDPRQLQAVGRGGMFDELCRSGPINELATIHRFHQTWEQAASLALRTASAAALDEYFRHDRVKASTFPSLQSHIAHRWVDADREGRSIAVVAETNSHVDALNLAIQATRLDLGHVGGSSAPLGGKERAHLGDHVVTRRNDRILRTDRDEPVRNRDRWTVQHVGTSGALTVSHQGGHGTVTLPADYVRSHVRLGYAATAHGNQGDTVDVGLVLVTPATSHRSLYVGATRGRSENQLLVVADDLDDARDILQQVLTNDRADVPAVVRRRELVEQVQRTPDDVGSNRSAQGGRQPIRGHPPVDRVFSCSATYEKASRTAQPYLDSLNRAQSVLDEAQRELHLLRRRSEKGGPVAKLRLRDPLRAAERVVDDATTTRDTTAKQARPHLDVVRQAESDLEAARQASRIDQLTQRLDTLQHQGPTRPTASVTRGMER